MVDKIQVSLGSCFKCTYQRAVCRAVLSRHCGGERLHIMKEHNDRYSDRAEEHNGRLAGPCRGTPRG